MHVNAALTRRIEDRSGENETVSCDNCKIRFERSKPLLFSRIAQRFWCAHKEAELFGALVNCGFPVSLAAPGRPRRLAIDRGNLMASMNQRVEAWHSKAGRSHENEAHGSALAGHGKRGQEVRTMASQEIEALSQALARLPGLGPRSARRAVLHLMKKREAALRPLLAALQNVETKLSTCSVCGNLDTSDPCSICCDPRRDEKMLCVVEEVADLWALDRSRLFPGRYHVLGGRLSALEGVRPEDLSIDQLVRRVSQGGIEEVVLAMNATLEGQTTAHYLAERLDGFPIRLSQLAHGLPVGGELDYLDEGTLAQALRARRPIA